MFCLILMHIFFSFFATNTHPKLKSRYKNHVKSASDYARTMDDFDELIDPGTLAHHFLGPEPSPYVLRAIAKEDKSKFLVLAYPFFFNLLLASCLWRSLQR